MFNDRTTSEQRLARPSTKWTTFDLAALVPIVAVLLMMVIAALI